MSRRIAIVEDEAAIRENYADVLRKQGYEVQTYANRKDAMAAFDIRLPNLAIIDIGLENEIDGGFTLCQALRSLSDTLPIIFLTARDNDFDTVELLIKNVRKEYGEVLETESFVRQAIVLDLIPKMMVAHSIKKDEEIIALTTQLTDMFDDAAATESDLINYNTCVKAKL